jgi:hypothetical protein
MKKIAVGLLLGAAALGVIGGQAQASGWSYQPFLALLHSPHIKCWEDGSCRFTARTPANARRIGSYLDSPLYASKVKVRGRQVTFCLNGNLCDARLVR